MATALARDARQITTTTDMRFKKGMTKYHRVYECPFALFIGILRSSMENLIQDAPWVEGQHRAAMTTTLRQRAFQIRTI